MEASREAVGKSLNEYENSQFELAKIFLDYQEILPPLSTSPSSCFLSWLRDLFHKNKGVVRNVCLSNHYLLIFEIF